MVDLFVKAMNLFSKRIITLYKVLPSDGIAILPREGVLMNNKLETLVEQRVTYTLQLNGQLYVIEDVPAQVNLETGEQFFSPSTVENLQQIILSGSAPDRFAEVPVYQYAA
jgi:hypothetical protein